MIGISARPASSLGKMLHQLCELAQGTTWTFLLQRMSPLLAIATDDALTANRRFRGIADIDRFSRAAICSE